MHDTPSPALPVSARDVTDPTELSDPLEIRLGPDPALARRIVLEVDKALKEALLTYAELMPPTLIAIGKKALFAPGKVISSAALSAEDPDWKAPRWPLLVVFSYQAALPESERAGWHRAVPGAAAVELAMAAADLLDEISDDDPSPVVAEYGSAQALNTGNLMLVMAQQALTRHAQAEGGERALRALAALQEMLVEAAVGQHLDMLYDRMPPDEVTPEMSLNMTAMKAGALMAGACRIGALLAGAGEEVVELIARVGREMGGIAQLLNDIQDVLPHQAIEGEEQPQRKTDLRMRKRTIPIVFTLRDKGEEPNALQRAFSQPQGEPVDEEELRRAILHAGGVQFAQLLIQVHRENATQALQDLEALRPGAKALMEPLLV